MLRFFAILALFFLFLNQKIAACGYNFLGDCSTSISLKINGTLDSFAVAPCPGVLQFDGFALGSLQSLSIARAEAATWESCQNNVSGVALWYRVYERDSTGGTWQSIDLQEDYNTLAGPYTTRYRSANANADLTNGLAVGKIYVLEIFFRAEIDTLGDDFIPETFLLQNNGGQNYHFTFQYGGASAPPFVVATTKIVHAKCHGDSTGVAGITVYGDPAGLFYEWSTGGNNFPILSEIPAGIYSVTVTGAGGYAASDTMEIVQPALLTKQMEAEICSGESYSLGGMSFAATGNYTIQVEGFPNCDTIIYLKLNVLNPSFALKNLPAKALVTCANPSFDLCAEPMASTTFQWFQNTIPTVTTPCLLITAGGHYQVMATTVGTFKSCSASAIVDIEEHLFLSPPQVYGEVMETVVCSFNDTLHLLFHVVTTAEEPVFQWILGGSIISTDDSCAIEIPGLAFPFEVPSVTVTDKYDCSFTQAETSIAIPLPTTIWLSTEVDDASGPNASDGTIYLDIFGGNPPYEVIWSNGATGISIQNLAPGTYCATVTDENGCTSSTCETVYFTSKIVELSENQLKIAPNPAVPGQWVEMTLPEKFRGQEVFLEILDMQGRALLRQATQLEQKSLRLLLPSEMPAGMAIIQVTTENGERGIGRLTLRR